MHPPPPPSPSATTSLRAEDVWRELCTTYISSFNDSESSTEPSVPVPLLLRPLFRHLRTTRKEHINLLSNGTGKSFVAAMFSVLDIEMNVRTSTTNDPRSDWCGVDGERIKFHAQPVAVQLLLHALAILLPSDGGRRCFDARSGSSGGALTNPPKLLCILLTRYVRFSQWKFAEWRRTSSVSFQTTRWISYIIESFYMNTKNYTIISTILHK